MPGVQRSIVRPDRLDLDSVERDVVQQTIEPICVARLHQQPAAIGMDARFNHAVLFEDSRRQRARLVAANQDLHRMIAAIRRAFRTRLSEITLEADPETIDGQKAAGWAQAGINRISFGVQSFSDDELKATGRLHRRAKQRRAAADAFAQAAAIFERLGAEAWAERARTELEMVGPRRRAPDELTATERRVAELAAAGITNREIARAVFMSEKTVEAHIARVYRKLGIHSRAELGARMAGNPPSSQGRT